MRVFFLAFALAGCLADPGLAETPGEPVDAAPCEGAADGLSCFPREGVLLAPMVDYDDGVGRCERGRCR